MDRIDYVAKAKALLKAQARTAALVIVPLAAAVSAQGGAILPTSGFTCSAGLSSCPSGSGVSQLADPGNGIQGIKFYTGSTTSQGSSGARLDFGTSGSLSGGDLVSGTLIPISYVFTFDTVSNGLSILANSQNIWSYQIGIWDSGSLIGYFGISGSATGTVSGSGSIALTSGAAMGDPITISATILTNVPAGNTVSLGVPPNSLDLNANVPLTTPEPASMGLMASALAACGWLFRRKRRA